VQDGSLVAAARNVHKRANSSRSVLARPNPLGQSLQAAIYGTRPRRKFREAATRYLTEFAWKRSIERDARALKDLDPFVGDVWLDCVHNDSFKAYIDTRRSHPPKGCKPLAAGTINRNLAVARRILNLAARLWRDKGSTLTWLAQAPLIQLLENKGARKPYPIDWSEQELLFGELTPHLQRAALFKVNTGMRQKEVCQLRWEWEQRVPELDTPEIKRTVFVLPEWVTKNKEARVVVLNDVAQRIVDAFRKTASITSRSISERQNSSRASHFTFAEARKRTN
jgi:integrase